MYIYTCSITCTYTHNYSNTYTYTHTVIQVQVLHTIIHMYNIMNHWLIFYGLSVYDWFLYLYSCVTYTLYMQLMML